MWRKKKPLKLWTVWSLWQREREWVRGRKIVRKGHPRQKIWAIQKGLMILYPSSETSAEVWIFESSKIWKARVFLGGGKYGIRRFVGRQNPATPMGKKKTISINPRWFQRIQAPKAPYQCICGICLTEKSGFSWKKKLVKHSEKISQPSWISIQIIRISNIKNFVCMCIYVCVSICLYLYLLIFKNKHFHFVHSFRIESVVFSCAVLRAV